MTLPNLAAPVKRFVVLHDDKLVYPEETVDVVNGRDQDLIDIRIDLLHGANYNDPAGFQARGYQRIQASTCGCGCWNCNPFMPG